MMKTFFLAAAIWLFAINSGSGQQVNKVEFDLINVSDDKISVTYYPPKVNTPTVEFHIPKIVPGTYSISDFGRFINDFKAYNQAGELLETKELSENRWQISNAESLHKITYRSDDTFDSPLENTIFEPGGTNIDAANNVFVLNTFGFAGYLEGYDKLPYELTVKHEPQLYGATSMVPEKVNETTDIFRTTNYFNLADAPIMYTVPDTAVFEVGGADILVSVYSPGKIITAEQVKQNVSEILNAQRQYLGGKLPINKYAFLIYLFSGRPQSGSYGALEHSYSSLYFLPNAGIERLGGPINDVAAHEFFHIITPLNIHAEQIGDFNFINPEMSEHLWLYEGVTEYAANHVQVKYGIISREEFFNKMRAKVISSSTRYKKNLPFTEMSRNVLKPEYEDQYGNVYEKGALIGMSLDLLLLKESGGTYNLQNLMRDLAKEYGPERSFKDAELFTKIEQLTYPAVGNFLKKYVDGKEDLPLEEVLSYAGVRFSEAETMEVASLGSIGLESNQEGQIVISDVSEMNEFGKAMQFRKGDILVSVNKQELDVSNMAEFVEDFRQNVKAGDKVKVIVSRTEDGKTKEKKLKGKAITTTVERKFVMEPLENPTPEQLKIREAWLSPDSE